MEKVFVLVAASLVLTALPASNAQAAGCVVSRGASSGMRHTLLGQHKEDTLLSPMEHAHPVQEGTDTGNFIAEYAMRYFKSDRHFSGREEHKNRQREGSEVINRSLYVDLSLTYWINERRSIRVTLPFVDHDRSSPIRDENRTVVDRYSTQATGIGDVRVVMNTWLNDPRGEGGNVMLGVGLDIPTGKKDSKDTFLRRVLIEGVDDSGNPLFISEGYEREVDQSIQLGDGGWGIVLDFYGFTRFRPNITGYIDASYTVTPEETSGVNTYRSNPYEAEMSITDSYQLRTGLEFPLAPQHNLRANLGLLLAGIPVRDWIGDSDGFRRPGYDISLEPGLLMDVGQWSFSFSVPVAFERNRQRSVADEKWSKDLGTRRHGDAAFADYQILLSVSKRI